MMRVLHIGHGHGGVGHSIVDYGIDGHGHGILRENLLRRDTQSDRPQIDLLI